MTEDEARENMICPMKLPRETGFGNCFGSRCKRWRWQVTRPEIGQTSVLDAAGCAHYVPLFGRPETSTTDGYCGLAGVPA